MPKHTPTAAGRQDFEVRRKWKKNKLLVDVLSERRSVLRSAASSKSFIVFTLGPYLAAAVGAS